MCSIISYELECNCNTHAISNTLDPNPINIHQLGKENIRSQTKIFSYKFLWGQIFMHKLGESGLTFLSFARSGFPTRIYGHGYKQDL